MNLVPSTTELSGASPTIVEVINSNTNINRVKTCLINCGERSTYLMKSVYGSSTLYRPTSSTHKAVYFVVVLQTLDVGQHNTLLTVPVLLRSSTDAQL